MPRGDYDISSYAFLLCSTSNMGKSKEDNRKDSAQAAREEQVNADIRSPQGSSDKLAKGKESFLTNVVMVNGIDADDFV